MIDVVQEKCEEIKDADIMVLKILSEEEINDGVIHHPFGIKELLKITCEKSKDGIQNSIIESLMNEGKNSLEKDFKDCVNNLKNNIYHSIDNNGSDTIDDLKIVLLGSNTNYYKFEGSFLFDNFQKYIFRSFIDVSQKLMFLNQNVILSDNSKKIVIDVMEIILKDLHNIIEEKFKKLIETQGNKLAKKYSLLIAEIDGKRNTNLGVKKNFSNLEIKSIEEINNLLQEEALEYTYKKIFKIFF